MDDIKELRKEIDKINNELLRLLNKRAKISIEIGKEKLKHGNPIYDPIRESEILQKLVENNTGPFSDEIILYLFKEIFKASAKIQKDDISNSLLVSRKKTNENTEVEIKGSKIGSGDFQYIFGPCSIESYSQLEKVAEDLSKKGLKYIRGGAFKPRTSPYDFQGLGLEGLKIMKEICGKYNLISVVEVMDNEQLKLAYDYVDIFQIGTRNMQNFSLLKKVGETDKPVILKRGMSATIEEFINAAEYIMINGNENIILCERGIRTFEKATRNTLDISSIPILKKETHLPVIVDVSHSTGRKDIILPISKSVIAVGADGLMAEVHPNPSVALSDANQQLSLEDFDVFYKNLK